MTNTPNGILEWIWFIATEYSDLFITGTLITLLVSVVGTIIGFILGFVVGIVEDTKITKDSPLPKKSLWDFSNGSAKSTLKFSVIPL